METTIARGNNKKLNLFEMAHLFSQQTFGF